MYKPWARAVGAAVEEGSDPVEARIHDSPEALFWAPTASLTSRMQSLMHSIIEASTHGGDDNDNESPSPFAGTQDSQESQRSVTTKRRKRKRWSFFKGTSAVYASEDQIDEISGHIAELESHIGAAEQHLDDLEAHATAGEIEIIETMRAEIRDIRGWVDAHHGKFSKNEQISIDDFEEAVGKIERRVARMEAMHLRLDEFSSVISKEPEPELAYE